MFKAGDQALCVIATSGLVNGGIYIVEHYDESNFGAFISVIGVKDSYQFAAARFIITTPLLRELA